MSQLDKLQTMKEMVKHLMNKKKRWVSSGVDLNQSSRLNLWTQIGIWTQYWLKQKSNP